jgi:tRNA A-37 threonylcarbamoyl transferase component Bud32
MDRIGRYKIVRELGRGAMGVVYHAIDPNIGRPVAIKTIDLGVVRKPEEQERLRERLFREARSAGLLSHPGIVTIYDVEQQGAVAYIAMEFVDGVTLDQLISEAEPLAPERLFSILGQTAAALDYAHQKGIVHRDIKPANVMIARDGTTKITDFGIAKITASDQYTMTGSIVGTPHYMSPEQVQGQAVDGRSDQFSLAVIAFEMLTGEKPYTGEHLTTVVYKIVAEEPVPPQRLNPSLGPEIGAVLRKGLAKKGDARYRSCQEFAAALERACTATPGWHLMARGGLLNEPTLAAVPAPALPPPRRSRRDDPVTEHGKRKAGFLTFLLAVLVATGLLALIGWQASPWLGHPAAPPAVQDVPAESPAKEPAPAPPPVAATGEEPKPSPLAPLPEPPKPPAADAPPADAPHAAVTPEPVRRAATLQPIMVISSPGGARANLDGRDSCTTPCTLDAAPGRHTVSVAMPGYGAESREVTIGSSPVELPAFVLRAPGGTLMVSSVPPGANVLINGKATGQSTPASIKLAAGSYQVTVEKEGRQSTQTVEIRNGISQLRILLGQ